MGNHSKLKPFRWLAEPSHNGVAGVEIVELAKDISLGGVLILDMCHDGESDEDAGQKPYLGPFERGVLNRMLVSSLQLLHDIAQQEIDHRNNQVDERKGKQHGT